MNPVRPLFKRYKLVRQSNIVSTNLTFQKVRSNGVKKFLCLLALLSLACTGWSYEITFKEKPAKIAAGQPVALGFTVGTANLEAIGGRQMHLVLVDLDLEWFHHYFPAMDAAGNFTQELVFPQDGRYLLYFYFQPVHEPAVVKTVPLDVGKVTNKFGTVRMYLDNEKLTDDWNVVRFITEPEEVKEKTEITFSFSIGELKSGKPVKNLLPFAGAGQQLVIIKATKDVYLQVQSEEQGAAAAGPELHFKATFPQKGIYKLWLEYRSKKVVNIVPLMIQVY